MDTEVKDEVFHANPEAKHLYETSEPFAKAIDSLFSCFEQAEASLTPEDYLEFVLFVGDEMHREETHLHAPDLG